MNTIFVTTIRFNLEREDDRAALEYLQGPGKGGQEMDQITHDELLRKYPYYIPVRVAAKYLGVSPRRLSQLVAEGRRPFSLIGADIGSTQVYVRIYTEPLVKLLNGELTDS